MMNGANTLIVSWRCLKRIDIICRNGIVNKLRDRLVEEVGRGAGFLFFYEIYYVFFAVRVFSGEK